MDESLAVYGAALDVLNRNADEQAARLADADKVLADAFARLVAAHPQEVL
jgi:hypothetical protein